MNLPLSGWKTYLAAVGFLIVAGYYAYQGQHEKAVEMFLLAMTAAGLRHAVAAAAETATKR